MIKHRPIPKTNVVIDGVEYKCKHTGILELPTAYEQFNPIEEEKKEIKPSKSKKKYEDLE